MPIYEYQCGKCGVEYEQLESSDAPKQQICIKMCGGLAKRLMSAPAIGHNRNGNNGHNHDDSSIIHMLDNSESNQELPAEIEKQIQDFANETGSKYIAIVATTTDQFTIGSATPIPDHIGDAIVKYENRKRAAPNN
jgi:putative FmdB family regulatory protein